MDFRKLDDEIATVGVKELHALVLALSARLAAIAVRLGSSAPDSYLTVEEASMVAKVRKRRIWEWSRARSATWAHHVGQRQLRIAEAPFRAWLANRDLTRGAAPEKSTKQHGDARGRNADAA